MGLKLPPKLSDEEYVDRATTNGGFPLPAASEPARLVTSRHEACGTETRLRLPRHLPARAVRRVVCERCAQPYEATRVEDRGVEMPRPKPGLPKRSKPSLPKLRGFDPRSPAWRYASIPLAAVAVIAILMLVQGDDSKPAAPSISPATEPSRPIASNDRVIDVTRSGQVADRPRRGADATPSGAELVSGSTYSLALPPGWERVTPEGGATFAAVAPDGDADATLWVERDPKLDFAEFEARSLDRLETSLGPAEVVNRVVAPTPEASLVHLAVDGTDRYEVILRIAGPYVYYLATTLKRGGSSEAVDGVRLVQDSFVPEGGGG